jgi:fibro-slime domain-containing protein
MICGDGIIDNPDICDETEEVDGSVVDIETSPICEGGFVFAAPETCDDGNTVTGDGCGATCQVAAGWLCPTNGDPCTAADCGDGIIAGTEICDDANLEIGDGCTPFCLPEPQCTDGVCLSICGDGIKSDTEDCDDGNVTNDDGCSNNCEVEFGFVCQSIQDEEPDSVQLAVVYRDFRGNDLDSGHVDFQNGNDGLEQGFVEDTLAGTPGKPVYFPGVTATVDSAASFDQWYRSVNDVNMTIAEHLQLDRTAPGEFVFDNQQFFPLTGRGFNGLDPASPLFEATRTDGDDDEQNFHFTSEVRYWFEFEGDEVLEFRGDDDVWVFINNKLAVDIGGVHGALDGSIDLGDPTAVEDLGLGIEVGGTYEVVVFQAERHTTRSSYKLTLRNFLVERSSCESTCGDGDKAAGEECDDGGTTPGDGCDENCELEGPVVE